MAVSIAADAVRARELGGLTEAHIARATGGERPLDVFAAGQWRRVAELTSGLEDSGAI